jgi:hypothetical protein
MLQRYDSLVGGLIGGVGLVVLSMWYWSSAPSLAAEASLSRRGLLIWAVRLAAAAGVSAAQFLLLTFVVSRAFRPNRFDLVLRFAAGVLFCVALAGAVAFALLARMSD